jgi:hypothetical protein
MGFLTSIQNQKIGASIDTIKIMPTEIEIETQRTNLDSEIIN